MLIILAVLKLFLQLLICLLLLKRITARIFPPGYIFPYVDKEMPFLVSRHNALVSIKNRFHFLPAFPRVSPNSCFYTYRENFIVLNLAKTYQAHFQGLPGVHRRIVRQRTSFKERSQVANHRRMPGNCLMSDCL